MPDKDEPIDGLPIEIQEWLQDVNAHKEAAERIGAFYETIISLTKVPEIAAQLTTTWMMIVYGVPPNMPPFQQNQ